LSLGVCSFYCRHVEPCIHAGVQINRFARGEVRVGHAFKSWCGGHRQTALGHIQVVAGPDQRCTFSRFLVADGVCRREHRRAREHARGRARVDVDLKEVDVPVARGWTRVLDQAVAAGD